ncbi:PspC domain-containing protein [Lactiplantibacillus plantarum]|uniref:PspC domain-containing protein n=1 Tax=Lactiplantibacillus plantarum TaxID=1590 RepID=UPI002F25ED51
MALRKSRKDRILLGVCGGIAECFQTSSTLVRLVFFFWIYLYLAYKLPEDEYL